LCYKPDPKKLIASFLVGYELSCINLSDYVSENCQNQNPVNGYNLFGNSTIYETIPKAIGRDIQWTKMDNNVTQQVTQVKITGWPVGSVVSYMIGNQKIQFTVEDENFPFKICGETESEIRSIIDTLSIQMGENSPSSFPLNVTVTTDAPGPVQTQNYIHRVLVVPSSKPSEQPSLQPSSMPSYFLPFFKYDGTSTVVEDTPRNIGSEIQNGIKLLNPSGVNPGIASVTLTNLPPGTVLTWNTGGTGPLITQTITSSNETVIFTNDAELATLSLQAPSHSDTDIDMKVKVTTAGPYFNNISNFTHPIQVLAVADKPQVVVESPLDVLETGKVPLDVTLFQSADSDGSESLIVRFTLKPSQGILEGVTNDVVKFTANSTTGEYTLTVTGAGDPAVQLALLNGHFTTGLINFVPTYGFGGQANVTVEVVSVEKADAPDLGPTSMGDPDTKVESDFAM
jgi:hypothetical protein